MHCRMKKDRDRAVRPYCLQLLADEIKCLMQKGGGEKKKRRYFIFMRQQMRRKFLHRGCGDFVGVWGRVLELPRKFRLQPGQNSPILSVSSRFHGRIKIYFQTFRECVSVVVVIFVLVKGWPFSRRCGKLPPPRPPQKLIEARMEITEERPGRRLPIVVNWIDVANEMELSKFEWQLDYMATLLTVQEICRASQGYDLLCSN